MNYWIRQKGMLASNAAEAIALLRTSNAVTAPDLELLFAPVEWREEGLKSPRVHGFTIAVIALTPRSRGSVTLVSPNIRTALRIDLALLAESADRDVMAFGIDMARRVACSNSLVEEA